MDSVLNKGGGVTTRHGSLIIGSAAVFVPARPIGRHLCGRRRTVPASPWL